MGILLICAGISSFVGVLGFILALRSGGSGVLLLIIALATNAAACISLIYEKSKHYNVRFKVFHLIYMVSVLVTVCFGGYVVIAGLKSSIFMTILFYIGFVVMLFVGPFVALDYYACNSLSRFSTEQREFFLPANQSRNVKKNLRTTFAFVGAFLLLIAVCIFIGGEIASNDSGDLAFTDCYKCDGVGRYTNRKGIIVSCESCNGSGVGAYKEDGENIFGSPALWMGIIGLGSLAMTRVLKEDY